MWYGKYFKENYTNTKTWFWYQTRPKMICGVDVCFSIVLCWILFVGNNKESQIHLVYLLCFSQLKVSWNLVKRKFSSLSKVGLKLVKNQSKLNQKSIKSQSKVNQKSIKSQSKVGWISFGTNKDPVRSLGTKNIGQ